MTETMQVLQYSCINQQSKKEIEINLARYLKKINKEILFNPLTYVVREITANASKANLKRVHFKKNHLDIHSERDYVLGMASFRDALTENGDLYESIAQKEGYYVKTHMGVEEDSLVLLIENNNPLLPEEKKRIDYKITRAQTGTLAPDDLYYSEIDATEGAGLGFISIINIMRNLGIGLNNFQIHSGKEKTSVKLAIPLDTGQEEEFLARAILEECFQLPHYPPHLSKLAQILGKNNLPPTALMPIIEGDPLLVWEILGAANARQRGVSSLSKAVAVLGDDFIKNEVLMKLIRLRSQVQYNWQLFEQVFQHSREVASFAGALAKYLGQENLREELATAALLHDIGKIVIATLAPESFKRIMKTMEEEKINPYLHCLVGKNHNHALIGALLAERWGLPSWLISVIRHHHLPFRVQDPEARKVCFILYLANLVRHYLNGKVFFNDIFKHALDFFQIRSQRELEILFRDVVQSA